MKGFAVWYMRLNCFPRWSHSMLLRFPQPACLSKLNLGIDKFAPPPPRHPEISSGRLIRGFWWSDRDRKKNQVENVGNLNVYSLTLLIRNDLIGLFEMWGRTENILVGLVKNSTLISYIITDTPLKQVVSFFFLCVKKKKERNDFCCYWYLFVLDISQPS